MGSNGEVNGLPFRWRGVPSSLSPTSMITGALAVGIAAYLAAVYPCWDAQRDHHSDSADAFGDAL
jgi:hypothetical protein